MRFLQRFLICILLIAPTLAYAGGQDVSDEYPFNLETTNMSANDTFQFKISASGNFTVDCGDDGILSGTDVIRNSKTITKNDTAVITYTCTYSTAGTHTIKFGGQATGYYDSEVDLVAAISFYVNSTKIAGIYGSLGAIFPTLNRSITNQKQPCFFHTFYNATNIRSSIPDVLFNGISGAPVYGMFLSTFEGCANLSGSIPSTLFAGISGAPAIYLFDCTFKGCSNLSGSIPDALFSGISGEPVYGMFYGTFSDCSGLTGYVPYGLFKNITGIGDGTAAGFDDIFSGANNLGTTCPAGTVAVTKPSDTWGNAAFCRNMTESTEPSQNQTDVQGPQQASCDNGQTKNCTVAHGAGTKTCENGQWGTCVVTECDDGYQKNNNMCDAIEYSITYVLKGGTNNSANPSKYTIESAITLGEPTRDGYVFDGWYENANFTGSAVTGIASGSTGNKTFWAKWSPSETPGASDEPDNPENPEESETPGGTDASDETDEPNVPDTPGDTGGQSCISGKTRACANGKSVQRCRNGQWGKCAPAYFIKIVK